MHPWRTDFCAESMHTACSKHNNCDVTGSSQFILGTANYSGHKILMLASQHLDFLKEPGGGGGKG